MLKKGNLCFKKCYDFSHTAVGVHHADHVAPIYPQKFALISPTSGDRSVDTVSWLTQAAEFSLVFMTFLSKICKDKIARKLNKLTTAPCINILEVEENLAILNLVNIWFTPWALYPPKKGPPYSYDSG
jgi:hypothetical protein